MRFVLCFLGLIATSLTAAVGAGFLLWDGELIANVPANILDIVKINENSTTSLTGISYVNAGLVTLLAALYGFLGSIFVLFRCGKQAGALLLVPVLGAAFMNPISLVFTWFAGLIGLMCFFVGPLPINASAQADTDMNEDEEEEASRPKAKVKAKPRKVADDDD